MMMWGLVSRVFATVQTAGSGLDKKAVEEFIDRVLGGSQLPEKIGSPPQLSGHESYSAHDEL